MSHPSEDSGREDVRAAIFVDYENIFYTLNDRLNGHGKPDELIAEMIDALQRSLVEERSTRTVVSRAYADFASLPGKSDRIQRSLYARGVEPLFVPRTSDAQTVELQLCVDSMDLLHHRTDISAFVLLTGRRTYIPLIQTFKRYGRRVLVVGLEEPRVIDDEPHLDVESFFPAGDLLSTTSRRALANPESIESDLLEIASHDGQHRPIEDPMLIRALQIIEEYFGQYEEVYLTPLLRKMSDILDENECDPKAVVSDLEDHMAARLEKRSGDPHDYTVLILSDGHPDVARVREDLRKAAEHVRKDGQDTSNTYVEDFHGGGA